MKDYEDIKDGSFIMTMQMTKDHQKEVEEYMNSQLKTPSASEDSHHPAAEKTEVNHRLFRLPGCNSDQDL